MTKIFETLAAVDVNGVIVVVVAAMKVAEVIVAV